MPTSITIRNVPDSVRDELAARAARSGRSLQEHLRATLIEVAARPTMEEVLDRIRRRTDATGTEINPDTILADRDADRR